MSLCPAKLLEPCPVCQASLRLQRFGQTKVDNFSDAIPVIEKVASTLEGLETWCITSVWYVL